MILSKDHPQYILYIILVDSTKLMSLISKVVEQHEFQPILEWMFEEECY